MSNSNKFSTLQNSVKGSIRFLVENDEWMVMREDLVKFADRILSAKYCILGIEGFIVKDGMIEPDMNAIADFGEGLRGADSLIYIEQFSKLDDIRANFYEIILR